MNIRFRYKKLWFPESSPRRLLAVRPIIPVSLHYRSAQVHFEVLLDSGADKNIFDAEIGTVLGVNITNGKKWSFTGVTGKQCMAYSHKLTLAVSGYEIETECGFSSDISLDGYGILGQDGFFNHFKVIFNRRAEVVELKSNLEH